MMNAVEFFFAVLAVSTATGLIYGWNVFVYSLDDEYGTYSDKPKSDAIIEDMS